MTKVIEHKSPLSGAQVQQIREKLGLNPLQLAELMGTTRRTVYRWENDEGTIPALSVTVLRMLDKRPDMLEFMQGCGECRQGEET